MIGNSTNHCGVSFFSTDAGKKSFYFFQVNSRHFTLINLVLYKHFYNMKYFVCFYTVVPENDRPNSRPNDSDKACEHAEGRKAFAMPTQLS